MFSVSRAVDPEPPEPAWVPQPRKVPARVRHRADAWTRPAHPADVAQARMFETVMQDEIAELEQRVTSMEKIWLLRCEGGTDGEDRPPESLVRMRGRVLEAQQLLAALQARFPSE